VIEDSCYNRISNSDPNSSTGSTTSTNLTYSTFNWGVNGLVNSTVFVDNTLTRARYHGSGVVGAMNTISFFVKMDDNTEPVIGNSTSTGDFGIAMDGGLFTGTTFKQHIYNNIWLVYASTTIASTSNVNGIIKLTSQSSKGFIVSGYQFTVGSLRPYLKTTNRLNVPCLDYSRSLLEPSLVIEAQRTNLVLRSEEFDNAVWLKLNSTVTANTTLSPNNAQVADKIVEDTNTGVHYVGQGVTLVSGTTYTYSIYAKLADDRDIRIVDGVQNKFITVDLTNGSVISSNFISYNVESVGNGWYRISFQYLSTTSGTVVFYVEPQTFGGSFNYLGNGTSGIYVWGAQIEVGSNATSYIPTTTATVTRNGATSFVDLFNNNMLNQNNFTLFIEGYYYSHDLSLIPFGLSDQTANNTNTNQLTFVDGFKGVYIVGGVATTIGTSLAKNSAFKIAIQYSSGSLKFFRNGVQMGTTYSVPVFNYRYIFLNHGSTTYSVDKIFLFNRTLSDLECADITD